MRALIPLLLLSACPGEPVDSTDDTDVDTSDLPCAERDADGDGVNACDDCEDADPAIFPGAPERCNGLDDDCDGAPHSAEADNDGDDAPDCAACATSGWWELVRDEAGASVVLSRLKADLAVVACDDYRRSREEMFGPIDKIDGQVECVYTGAKFTVGAGIPDAAILNTEHTWPQSLGADNEPAKCDLGHLFPVTPESNTQRSNNPYGLVARDVSWQGGGSRLGESSDGRRVFEPRPEHRGDVARAMYYFSLRYGDRMSASTRTTFWNPQKATLLAWHAQDPPNHRERERSLAIRAFQDHANPFVVCPSLLPLIEGDL